MVAGLEEISDGELYIGDKLVNDVAPKDRDIAMVFQNYALYPHMTVFDNMAFGLKLRKTPKDEIKRRVEEAARVLGIDHLLNRKPKALSAERQRVALGRAIVREPKVFLFDEPLSNLDAKLRVQMRTEITKLHQRLQTTFIYVTHDQTEAMTMASRIVVMKDGVVQQVDTPQNLYDFPANEFVAGFIGSPQMNFFDVRLKREKHEVVAYFGDNKIVVPQGKVSKFVDESYVGREVVMGIRPENIHDDEMFLANAADAAIDVKVEVTEKMGSELPTYRTYRTTDRTERTNELRTTVRTVRTDPTRPDRPGTRYRSRPVRYRGTYVTYGTVRYGTGTGTVPYRTYRTVPYRTVTGTRNPTRTRTVPFVRSGPVRPVPSRYPYPTRTEPNRT